MFTCRAFTAELASSDSSIFEEMAESISCVFSGTMVEEHPAIASSATHRKELITSRFMRESFLASTVGRIPNVAPIARAVKRACYRPESRSFYRGGPRPHVETTLGTGAESADDPLR